MKNWRLVFVTFAALIAATSSVDVGTKNIDEYKKFLLKELAVEPDGLEGQNQDKPDSDDDVMDVSAFRYITCNGRTWSCEDCNTRKWCWQFWWSTTVKYFQCPMSAPYCVPSSNYASCSNTAAAGCSGEATTASTTTTARPSG